jgi:hypothetical protein
MRYRVIKYRQTVNIDGAEVPVTLVKFRHPKVCPACLQESNYCRKVWDLLPFTACDAHKLVLLDICPGCGLRVSWARNRVSLCHCGFDWRNAPKVKASPETLYTSRRISEICAGGNLAVRTDKEPLYRLGLGDFCEALSLIADHYHRMKEDKQVTTDTENSACHDAFTRAFLALEEWPHSFEKFLNEYGLGKVGGRPEFRSILELHKLCKERDIDFVTVALEEFLDDESFKCGEYLWEMRGLSKRFVPIRELDGYFNVRPGCLEGLVQTGRIRAFRKEGGSGYKILIDLVSVARFKRELSSSLTSFDAARRLGMARLPAAVERPVSRWAPRLAIRSQ